MKFRVEDQLRFLYFQVSIGFQDHELDGDSARVCCEGAAIVQEADIGDGETDIIAGGVCEIGGHIAGEGAGEIREGFLQTAFRIKEEAEEFFPVAGPDLFEWGDDAIYPTDPGEQV